MSVQGTSCPLGQGEKEFMLSTQTAYPRPNPQSKRHWIKVRLGRGEQNEEAAEIISDWREQREAAPKLTRAIRLWDALERGDMDVLQEFLPLMGAGLVAMLGTNGMTIGVPSINHETRITRMPAPAVIEAVQKSEEEDSEDFFESLGLDTSLFS